MERDPEYGVEQLTGLIAAQGLDQDLARKVAVQLSERDALTAHARYELGIDPDELTNPWHAAWVSMLAFVIGAVLPLATILLSPRSVAVPVTALAVTVALIATGSVSAHLGRAAKVAASLRTVAGGLAAMAVTYAIGSLIGSQV